MDTNALSSEGVGAVGMALTAVSLFLGRRRGSALSACPWLPRANHALQTGAKEQPCALPVLRYLG